VCSECFGQISNQQERYLREIGEFDNYFNEYMRRIRENDKEKEAPHDIFRLRV
jgi:hypothetical protein